MTQCVPNWELDDDPPNPTSQGLVLESSAVTAGAAQSRSDYKVAAELTWVNGHLSMHGLEQLRIGKSDSKSPGSWDKTLINSSGTLESLVDQATGAILFPNCHESPTTNTNFELVPNWLTSNTTQPNCTTNATTSAMMDALVPCANNQMLVPENIRGRKRMRDGNCNVSTGSAASMGLTFDDVDVGFTTSTSPFDCTENTSSGRPMTIVNEHDSACHSHRSQREDGYVAEENQKGEVTRSSISTKRSRAAAVHNQSERKRRDKINQRMKTLQKLVPNSSKADKASMLDEVIDYLKQLQAQVQMMNRLSTIPQMLMPMQQMQQMMAQMVQMGMPMPMALDMTAQNRPPPQSNCFLPPRPPPPMHLPPLNPFAMPPMASPMTIPIDPFSAFNMASQPQKPMSMDALNRMAANMYQQMYHQTTNQNPTSNPK